MRQRLLGNDAPAGAGHGGEPCQHVHAGAVAHLLCAIAQRRQLIDQCIALDHRAYALGIRVVEQAPVAIDHIEVGAILVEVFAQQAFENVVFAQVQSAAYIAKVAAVGVEDRLRQHHHQVVGGGEKRRRHQRMTLAQRLGGAGCLQAGTDHLAQRCR